MTVKIYTPPCGCIRLREGLAILGPHRKNRPRDSQPDEVLPRDSQERLVFYCRTTSASTAPCTSRRMCCPTLCASYYAPCQPLLRAFSGWFRSPPPTETHNLTRRRRSTRGSREADSLGTGPIRSTRQTPVQGYLAHEKQHPPRTLQQD